MYTCWCWLDPHSRLAVVDSDFHNVQCVDQNRKLDDRYKISTQRAGSRVVDMVILSTVIDCTLVELNQWPRLPVVKARISSVYWNKLNGQYYRDLLRVLTKRPYSWVGYRVFFYSVNLAWSADCVVKRQQRPYRHHGVDKMVKPRYNNSLNTKEL